MIIGTYPLSLRVLFISLIVRLGLSDKHSLHSFRMYIQRGHEGNTHTMRPTDPGPITSNIKCALPLSFPPAA